MQVKIKRNKEDSYSVYLDAPPAHEIHLRRFSGIVDGQDGLRRAVSMAYAVAEAVECEFVVREE